MNKTSKIYLAGHNGLVGSALLRKLKASGYENIIVKTSRELDLRRQADVEEFFEKEKPEYVFVAAAKVGGILANSTYKAEFIYDNITIAVNLINSAYKFGVKKLLNLGSSCIYPKFAPQPMKEEHLLTGILEPTNEPYSIAKIAAIKLCRYYNEQYGTNFISVMPTNLYGPGDNYNLETAHVLPSFIRKFHLAKLYRKGDFESIKKDFIIYGNNKMTVNDKKIKIDMNTPEKDIILVLPRFGINASTLSPVNVLTRLPVTVSIWGSGEPFREFLYVDDLADACLFLMERFDYKDVGEIINIGIGEDLKIKDLAKLAKNVISFDGEIKFDVSKPDGTPKKLLDSSKIKSLGWEPKISLPDGIKRTYKYYVSK